MTHTHPQPMMAVGVYAVVYFFGLQVALSSHLLCTRAQTGFYHAEPNSDSGP